jgi:competence protein ComEC
MAMNATATAPAAALDRPIIALESIWRAPLVPVALAATCGIVLDRYFSLPLLPTFLIGLAGLLLFAWLAWTHEPLGALACMALTVAAFAATYHHWRRDVYSADDIGNFATADPRPVLLRGIVDSEPLLIKRGGNDDLRSFASRDGGRLVLAVNAMKQELDWQPVSGLALIHTTHPLQDVHVGDRVEVAGRLRSPDPPANPGEFDYAGILRDQRIRAIVSSKDLDDQVALVTQPGAVSINRGLAHLRAWGQNVLTTYLPAQQQGPAIALLLGDGAPMTQDDWDKYVRTGVIHVLAISGQHLVILGGFLAVNLRLMRVRLRPATIAIVIALLAYAMLVGGRPPVMRAVVAVAAMCGGLLLRRRVLRANTFALAWLAVALLNPTDLFSFGCLLSFLAVAVLCWGTRGWFLAPPDPLDRLVEANRPAWQQMLLGVKRQVLLGYALTLAIWVVVAPLVAARQNVLSLAGLVIGPPTVVLTTIALLSGFALLLLAAICPPLAPAAALVTRLSMGGCEALVTWAATWPGGSWFVPSVPEWWLWVYYPVVLGLLMLQSLRRVWTWGVLALLAWITVGLVAGAAKPRTDELRCTFLAVGHGGCIVVETPEGRTLLYDVGSLTGPEVLRRNVAPYLWHCGIRRIDEVLLSHADLDHFNGLTALLDRFAVGQVSCTPTFQERATAAVRRTVEEIKTRGVPLRVLTAGTRLRSGSVDIEVLHPPAIGPDGKENCRSLVLLIQHASHTILLTGDLEGTGTDAVVSFAPPRVDAMMAPHHGNQAATEPLIGWCHPQCVVSCDGIPRAVRKPDPDRGLGPLRLATWPHGAVTIQSRAGELTVTTYQTNLRWVLAEGR